MRIAAIIARRRSGRSLLGPMEPAPPCATSAGRLRARAILRSRTAAPDKQPLEVERHRPGRAGSRTEPRRQPLEKFCMTIFRERVEKRAQPRRSIPLNYVGRPLHGMVKRKVIAVDSIVAELRQHRGVELRRLFMKCALASAQHLVRWRFASEAAAFHLRGLGFGG